MAYRARALMVLVTVGALCLVVGVATPAAAVVGVPVTYNGALYPSDVKTPTADKPQSKLWYAGGAWWALMVSTGDRAVHIFELQTDHTWRDTGTVVDDRLNSTGDALWNGSRLYVVSRTATGPPEVTRFAFDAGARTWSMDSGFPILLNTGGGSESATIDQDSTGRLWVTYTRLAKVWVAVSDLTGAVWTSGFRPQVPDTAIATDDISGVIAFNNSVGVLWSDQASDVFRFAVHKDSDPISQWTVEDALAGSMLADDHVNLKQMAGDSRGRIFAAIKTSTGDDPGAPATAMNVGVLIREPRADGTGVWSVVQAGSVADDHTRPILMIDETNQDLYFIATAPVDGGDIYYKKTPLANPSFGPGRGTKLIDSTRLVNNATGSKQTVTAQSGLVVLAVAEAAKRYVHAEMELAGGGPGGDSTPPSTPSGLVATPGPGAIDLQWGASSDNVGVTGYTVQRNDGVTYDTAQPTFRDTAVSPGQTYTYTVQAFDAAGNRSAASAPVTATVPNGAGPVTLRGVTNAANAATNTLVVPVPTGTQSGDVLLASVDVRGNPTITPPAGWQLVRQDANGTAMKMATYWRLASAAEPAEYTWRFSGSPAAVGIMLGYSGVSATTPIDAAGGQTASSKSITAPAVTTSVNGAQLVTLFGIARLTDIAPPAGLPERSEVDSPGTVQYPLTAAAADTSVAVAGSTGAKTATATVTGPNVGQSIALRPAS